MSPHKVPGCAYCFCEDSESFSVPKASNKGPWFSVNLRNNMLFPQGANYLEPIYIITDLIIYLCMHLLDLIEKSTYPDFWSSLVNSFTTECVTPFFDSQTSQFFLEVHKLLVLDIDPELW